jgi:hypothetical protein
VLDGEELAVGEGLSGRVGSVEDPGSDLVGYLVVAGHTAIIPSFPRERRRVYR